MKSVINNCFPRGIQNFLIAALVTLSSGIAFADAKAQDEVSYFIGLKKFSDFQKTAGESPNEVVLTSREFSAPIPWDELVVSWNAMAPAGTYLKLEVRGVYPEHTTKFYSMGFWSVDGASHPRESVRH